MGDHVFCVIRFETRDAVADRLEVEGWLELGEEGRSKSTI